MLRVFKILLLTILLYLCVAEGHAQIQTLQDTLSAISPEFYKRLQIERGQRRRSDNLYIYTAQQIRLQFIQSNVAQLLGDTLPAASTLQLSYKNNRRAVRLPTEAYSSKAATLYTEGFTTIGKAKIMGKFFLINSGMIVWRTILRETYRRESHLRILRLSQVNMNGKTSDLKQVWDIA
ncbi:hypothetical protein MKP07_02740 [Niabella hibiscisoli]|nr:hypothetical protein [Niabella hibiscisoli]MCH5715178.1 hypothetical protein [Niabella hibiscisoli]